MNYFHKVGSLYYCDLKMSSEMFIRDTMLINRYIEHQMRIIRSDNYFIYKIWQPGQTEQQKLSDSIVFRFELIQLKNPKIVISDKIMTAIKKGRQAV